MNSCVLMAKIVRDPQLRSTQDQVSVSSMLVEFPSTREEDPPGVLKVEGWGKLAEEMKSRYTTGDNIIIEGRLSMNLLERDGYKEKKATLVASRIYPVGESNNIETSTGLKDNQGYPEPDSTPSNVVDFASTMQAQPTSTSSSITASVTVSSESTAPNSDNSEDWDEIPFVRPVYSRTNFGSQLCDSWELEANRYWDGVKQFV